VTVTATAATRVHTAAVALDLYHTPPADVTLLTPGDGATAVDLIPTLTWQNTALASSYVVEITQDADFITDVFTVTVSGTSFTMPEALDALTTYYWRVRAENACGPSEYSAVRSFTTELKACAVSPLPVPDGIDEGVVSNIVLSRSVVIDDLDVWLDMSHSWVGDLKFVLKHIESGTQVTLIDRPGVPATTYGCHGDDIDVILDDSAAELVENACNMSSPTLAGALRPMEALAAFQGELWSGTWQLSVIDTVAPDLGVLNNWCLLPTYDPIDFDNDLYLPLVVK
jgi:subtilisin-like proprotein convertase family protein